ncbi:MAG: FAD-dependent oxidoreductase [Ilumatobacteraceae bacterium]
MNTHPRQAADVASWDHTADVVVVGFGCAGAAAAIEARKAGADVLVLEKTTAGGGSSAIAGGEIYLGGGTSIQQACGFDDSSEEMFKFLMEACGPNADAAKVGMYSDGSVAHFDWLVEIGVPFKPSFWGEPCWVPPTDDGLMWLGENSAPFNEIAKPAPRGHRPQADHFGGWLLMDRLGAEMDRLGAGRLGDTSAERLVVERDGRITGVIARQYGNEIAVRARRGVVLATGGFVYNEEMVARHAPVLLGHGKVGTDTDDGRGILMAQSVGAAVKGMDTGQAGIALPPLLLARSLLVNDRGQRFINEDTYPGRVGQYALYHHGGRVFMILDEETFETTSDFGRRGAQPTWVCETLDELEAEMGLPPGSLQSTVELFNRHAAEGADPMFRKDPKWLKPLRSPFGAIDVKAPNEVGAGVVEGVRTGFNVFTTGGLHTSLDGEVLGLDGEPIPGLFACGRVTSSIQAWGYISGTSLGEGTFFGRRTGTKAAAV